MATDDISVTVEKLPGSINAFVHIVPSGKVCIVVNDLLSPEARQEAMGHEIEHLIRDDMSRADPVNIIENRLREKACDSV